MYKKIISIIGILFICTATACDGTDEILTELYAALDDVVDRVLKESEEEQEAVPVVEVPDNIFDSELSAYNQLTEEEKLVYNQICEGIESHRENIMIEPAVTEEVLEKSTESIYIDHPEYFWYDNEYTYWTSKLTGLVTDVAPEYALSEEERSSMEAEIQLAADRILEGIPEGASKYEKVRHVYESVIFSTEYVEECEYNQSIISVFLNKQTVCAGYAKAIQYLLHELEIPCAYVYGESAPLDEPSDAHAWNIVEIDDEYYYIDATWGDPASSKEGEEIEIEYAYLCCSDRILNKTHTMDMTVQMPACTSELYDYYQMNNSYYETYDREQIQSILIQMTENKEQRITFVFETNEQAQLCIEDFSDSDFVEIAGMTWAEQQNLDYWEWNVLHTQQLNKVEFCWGS